MKNITSRKNLAFLILGLIGILTCVSYFFCIYYSVPASDDFAMSLGRDGFNGWIDEFVQDIIFFWKERGGGVFYFATQLLFNPLNMHVHLGHAYGLYMIIAFIGLIICMLLGLYSLFDLMLGKSERYYSIILTAIILIAFLQNDYYVEAYNWYVGMNAYVIPLAMLFLTVFLWNEYGYKEKNGYYIASIITGAIAANAFLYDVTLGIVFLYLVFYKNIFHKDGMLKKSIPLVVYILVGIVTVLAPGNFARQQIYGEPYSLVFGIKHSAYSLVYFNYSYLRYKPLSVLTILIVFLLGVWLHNEISSKVNILNVILCCLCFVIAEYGVILPYMFGRSMTDVYMDVRVRFFLDVLIIVSMCILSFMIGTIIGNIELTFLNGKTISFICGGVLLIEVVFILLSGNVKKISSVDICYKASDIEKSYELWDGILLEIERNPETETIVTRDYNVAWNKYFLYSGMEPEEEYAQPLDTFYSGDQILPNVYYKKEKIVVNYPRE